MIVILYISLAFVQHTAQFTSPVLTGYNLNTTYVKQQIQCVEEALFHESRSESPEGIHAVLSVIYNRTKHKSFRGSFCDVVHQPYQFSYRNYVRKGKPVKTAYKPSEHKVRVTIASYAFDAVVGPFKASVDDDVLYYHTTKLKKNLKWNKKDKIYATIGNHIFIRS